MNKNSFIKLFILFLISTFLLALPMESQAQSKKDRQKAKVLATQGDEFYRQKNYRAAIDKYAQALASQPDFPFARFSKGYAHYNLKEYDQAANEFGIALDQGYEPLEIYAVRWQTNVLRKKPDLALDDVQKAIKLAPDNAYFYIAQGQIYDEQKNYKESLAAFQKALSIEDKTPDVHFYIAKSYNALGDYSNQEASARKALAKGTTQAAWSWFYIADSLQKRKKQDEAVEAYERVLTADKTFYSVYLTLSDIYRNQGKYDKSINLVKAGILQFPNDSDLYTSLSWYYSLNDKTAYAIEAAKKAIELSPNEYMAYTNLCRAYNESAQYSAAIRTCNKALELQPGDGETNFYLGRAYDFQNQTDAAAKHYKEAVKGLVKFTNENPDYSDGFYLLGNAFYADRQKDKAITAYKKALELSPRYAKARYNLGYMYVLGGDLTAAREQQTALKNLDPDLAAKLLEAMDKKK